MADTHCEARLRTAALPPSSWAKSATCSNLQAPRAGGLLESDGCKCREHAGYGDNHPQLVVVSRGE